MERRRSENVSDVLSRFLNEEGLVAPLAEYRLLQAWPEVAGATTAAQTLDVRLQNQTLIVRLRSASLRQTLMMRRSMLVNKLNAAAGRMVITDIRFQ